VRLPLSFRSHCSSRLRVFMFLRSSTFCYAPVWGGVMLKHQHSDLPVIPHEQSPKFQRVFTWSFLGSYLSEQLRSVLVTSACILYRNLTHCSQVSSSDLCLYIISQSHALFAVHTNTTDIYATLCQVFFGIHPLLQQQLPYWPLELHFRLENLCMQYSCSKFSCELFNRLCLLCLSADLFDIMVVGKHHGLFVM